MLETLNEDQVEVRNEIANSGVSPEFAYLIALNTTWKEILSFSLSEEKENLPLMIILENEPEELQEEEMKKLEEISLKIIQVAKLAWIRKQLEVLAQTKISTL